jgi:hypothetical protein
LSIFAELVLFRPFPLAPILVLSPLRKVLSGGVVTWVLARWCECEPVIRSYGRKNLPPPRESLLRLTFSADPKHHRYGPRFALKPSATTRVEPICVTLFGDALVRNLWLRMKDSGSYRTEGRRAYD